MQDVSLGTTYDAAAEELTGRVKEVALRSGATVVGVASPEAFNEYVPDGHRPSDFLPGARSVVVTGCRGPSRGAWRSPNHRVMEISGYDFRENVAAHAVADYIERELGYYVMQAPALPTAGHTPPMSMMLSAVLAGLGTRSIAANIILNPTYGLLYYAAVITTLPLLPDHQLEERVCPAPMCVKTYETLGKTPCMAVCPADQGGCLDATIENGEITHSHFDRERCVTRAMNFGINGHGVSLERAVNAGDEQERHETIWSDGFRRNLAAVGRYKESVAQCFECMRVCPVGKSDRRLK